MVPAVSTKSLALTGSVIIDRSGIKMPFLAVRYRSVAVKIIRKQEVSVVVRGVAVWGLGELVEFAVGCFVSLFLDFDFTGVVFFIFLPG
jgi:hypothetical protein